MLKRLLIAVFVLSLIMAFSGSALAGNVDNLTTRPLPVKAVTQMEDGTFRLPSHDVNNFTKGDEGYAKTSVIPELPPYNATKGTDLTSCWDQDYTNYGTDGFYTWTRSGGDTRELGMRFSSSDDHFAEVEGSYFYLSSSLYADSAGDGIEIDITVYGNAGGVPDDGNIMHVEHYIATGTGWQWVGFTGGPVNVGGGDYYIGMKHVGPTADTIRFYSDDGDDSGVGFSSMRAVYRSAGVWGTAFAVFGGWSPNFLLSSFSCEYYSVCNYNVPNFGTGDGFVTLLPRSPEGDGSVRNGFGMRFVAEGPETLKVVDLWHYSFGDATSGYYRGTNELNYLIFEVWNDDGAGNVDSTGGPLATYNTPSGYAALYPYTGDGIYGNGWDLVTADFTGAGLVLYGPYHVTIKVSSTNQADGQVIFFLTDPVVNPGPSGASVFYDGSLTEYWARTGLSTYFTAIGETVTDIEPYTCKDEFTNCDYQELYNAFATNLWGLPSYPGAAQKVKGLATNRVQRVDYQLWDDLVPGSAGFDAIIGIYTDDGGLPGTLVYEDTVPYASIIDYPGWNSLVIPDLQISGDFHVSLGQTTPDSGGFTWLADYNGPASNNGGGSYYSTGSGSWKFLGPLVGEPIFNWMFAVDFCGIPFQERTCDDLDTLGWMSYQGDLGRTGASNLSLGDAWCDLSVNWLYEDPTGGVLFAQPIVYGDKIICSFADHYVVFNSFDGTIAYTLDSAGVAAQANTDPLTPTKLTHDFLITSDVRCAPTVKNIGGTDIMFISGGFWQAVGAVDFATGNVIWSRTVNDPDGLNGQTRFCVFNHFTIGADEVIVYGTESGKVVARNALTGAFYTGWTLNPIQLNGETFASGATDGTSIFFSSFNGASGDVYSIDAATGTINWTLAGAGGFGAADVYEAGLATGGEGFSSGVAFDFNQGNSTLYAVSRLNGDYPSDGVFYSIDPATGNHKVDPQICNRGFYTTPIVDLNHVYVPTLTGWMNPPVANAYLLAFQKSNGSLAWTHIDASASRYYSTGFLSCEPEGGHDQIYLFNESGFLQCISSVDGNEIFRRRVSYSPAIGVGGAIAYIDGTVHVLFAAYWGALIDLINTGIDRPRLEFQGYNMIVPVEFGNDPILPVDAGPFLVNTGCANLNFISTQVDEASITGTSRPFSANYIPNDYLERAEKIFDDLSRDAFMSKFSQANEAVNEDIYVRDAQERDTRTNLYSAGTPSWFVSMTHPTAGDFLAAGDTMNLEFVVNQPLISRGPQSFYLSIETDDPDFFMNDTLNLIIPEAFITVIGGCLMDTVMMDFGVGAANYVWVSNSTRIGGSDWAPTVMNIDGDESYYAGFYWYGVDSHSVAVNTESWNGIGASSGMVSIQADPDFCDNDCKPLITAGVTAGFMTNDGGATYSAVIADMVCKSFIDSVQNFDRGGGWDWDSGSDAPFDNPLTMGLICDARYFTVIDMPEFHNFTFEIFNYSERNGNPVENWYMSHTSDYDVGQDSINANFAYSAAWDYHGGSHDVALGIIKIPFGCGELGAGHDFDYNPLINAKGMTGNQGMWTWGNYWDSAYTYASSGAGFLAHQPMNLEDAQTHMTVAGHDFAGGDSYSLGIAQFAFVHNIADAEDANSPEIIDLATFINKWAGFGRGDVNDDGVINLADIIYLAATVNYGIYGSSPFEHLSDVNADGGIDAGDVAYLIDYYFNCGPCPMGNWAF